jgi:hypothetical protein
MIDITTILDKVASHALATGLFERVNTHESSNPPGNGLTCEIWSDMVRPIQGSGLASVSVTVLFMVRIRMPGQAEPADQIDPDMITALDTLCAAYVSDFTLDGSVRHVDIFGIYGVGMEARAGWLIQDTSTQYRIVDIFLPLVVDDAWQEAP